MEDLVMWGIAAVLLFYAASIGIADLATWGMGAVGLFVFMNVVEEHH